MTSPFDRLLTQAGPALSNQPAQVFPDGSSDLRRDLARLLGVRNGFHAFSGALLVLPADDSEQGLRAWNDPDGWRARYGGHLHAGLLVFAHDLFGNAFALHPRGVVLFDAETGGYEEVSRNLVGWAQAMTGEPHWTGEGLAQAWQTLHGPLPAGQRLVPERPFRDGGPRVLTNLRSAPLRDSLLRRADALTLTSASPAAD